MLSFSIGLQFLRVFMETHVQVNWCPRLLWWPWRNQHIIIIIIILAALRTQRETERGAHNAQRQEMKVMFSASRVRACLQHQRIIKATVGCSPQRMLSPISWEQQVRLLPPSLPYSPILLILLSVIRRQEEKRLICIRLQDKKAFFFYCTKFPITTFFLFQLKFWKILVWKKEFWLIIFGTLGFCWDERFPSTTT